MGRCYSQDLRLRVLRCCGEVLSPLTFEGHCDSNLMEAWFEQQLAPTLRPGQVVILDNASFHRPAKLKAILAKVGCSLLLLPPYSPDLNKIEPLWNTLKRKIEHDKQTYSSFRLKVDAVFM